MRNDNEVVYTLTPKGWIECIKTEIAKGDLEGAFNMCNRFEKWIEEHVKQAPSKKKKKK